MRHALACALILSVVLGPAACGPSAPSRTSTQAEMPATRPPSGPASPSRVETKSFVSAALGVEKDYVVYLPAGYDSEPDRRWPVLYYLHGLTGDETNWSVLGDIAAAADRIGLRAIIVMPDGDDGFYTDADPSIDYDYPACIADGSGLFLPGQPQHKTCVKHRRYQTYIVDDLIGHTDATYRTIATRDGRGIAGLSMGGFGALQLAMRHKDVFAAAASHSGVDALLYRGPHPYEAGKADLLTDVALWGRGIGPLGSWVRDIFGADVENWRAHDPAFLVDALKPGELALYLDCGTGDGFLLHDGAAYLHDLLLAKKIDHAFFLGPGGHDFEFWRARVPESLAFLSAHVAAPTP